MTDATVTDHDQLLKSVCARVAHLAASSHVGPRVIRMSVSGVSVEVEWPDYGDPPAERPSTVAEIEPPTGERPDLSYVSAPSVGRFYHCPSVGARPFVTIGDWVEEGQQVGIIEAMKLMMPINAPACGVVEEILVMNEMSVEYGERLIALSTAAGDE